MTQNKAEQDALAEEQRRQKSSVVDLAREQGMSDEQPIERPQPQPEPDKAKEK